ncbi:MAG: hypothetical protein AUG51_09385 [Acidobacteria bacterium 13_1_20CM_3_53_8]|nr:MAG: hypothetical protein AUG51_09385 [Acidobacteria bacterium 13_1_20CM_3_53_8]
MKGIGGATLAKLRRLEAAGGWMDSEEWFALNGRKGNRTPFLIFGAKVLDSFSYCDLRSQQARIGYRLTEAGRSYLESVRSR